MNPDDTVALLVDLIALDSVNPSLVEGGAGESAIAAFCAEWLASRGFSVEILKAVQGRPSVLATSKGSGGGASVMLNGHLDTVALSSYDGDGLTASIRDGEVHGRGAYDMKSGIAAIMVAAASAAADPHRGDIVVALVADEEWGSAGTEEVLEHRVTDTAIIVEPSGLDLVVAHRGFVWSEVTVHGVAAHGSRPDLGVDAIAKTGRVLTAIDDLGRMLAAGPRDAVLGTGSVHASTIHGGAEASSYPNRCVVVIERRTIPGEDDAFVESEMRSVLDSIAAVDAAFRANLRLIASRPPFAAASGSETAAAVTRAFRAVRGRDPITRGEPFWTDCALLADAGIDTVLFGVDGGGAHAADEWVTVDSLHTTTETLRLAVLHLTA